MLFILPKLPMPNSPNFGLLCSDYAQLCRKNPSKTLPNGPCRKVAIDATLRAAAVHQLSRRRRHGDPPGSKRVYIEKDDLRNKRMSRRAGSGHAIRFPLHDLT
jgi:hypothetical protein